MTVGQWLSTPAEPRWKYALFSGVLTFALMFASSQLWSGSGILGAAVAGGISGGISGIVAKLWMERRA